MAGDWPFRHEILRVSPAELVTDPCPTCLSPRWGNLSEMCLCPLPCGCGRGWLGRQPLSSRLCCTSWHCGVMFEVAAPRP
jgi:hypothetical protein